MAEIKTWVASFQGRALRTWEEGDGYLWSVTESASGAIVAHGAVSDLEDALIAAAEAAGADWGNAKWSMLPVGDDS